MTIKETLLQNAKKYRNAVRTGDFASYIDECDFLTEYIKGIHFVTYDGMRYMLKFIKNGSPETAIDESYTEVTILADECIELGAKVNINVGRLPVVEIEKVFYVVEGNPTVFNLTTPQEFEHLSGTPEIPLLAELIYSE